MSKKTIRIGNAGGYWGDDPHALKRQVEKGHLDYITMDFLAEVTMSILKKQQARDPNRGYAYDLIPMLKETLPSLIKNKTRLITNAGGINPSSCAQAISELAATMNLSVNIAVVYGDDILPHLDELTDSGSTFTNMETGQNFEKVKDKIEAANVYFGAAPVVAALKKWQPDIIITGRVTDTGITLAPMIYEFGWKLNDWNKLASGVVAGHCMECGSQVTGGNYTDWHKVSEFNEIGYPIVEVRPDGSFVVTKHQDTGGLVSIDTVREQLFYEMGHPNAYITPDVIADFSSIHLTEINQDQVEVSGIKGYEPTDSYKVSMAFSEGFKSVGSIVICGPNARAKAEAFAEIFWNKCDAPLSEKSTELLGFNALHRSLGHNTDGTEILLRLGARSPNAQDLRTFGKLVPSLILSGPPGVAVLGGVPRPQEVVSYWPALLKKERVHPRIALFNGELKDEWVIEDQTTGSFVADEAVAQTATAATKPIAEIIETEKNLSHTLLDICLARSGDKGDMANIGLCARSPKAYQFIKTTITAQKVKNWFQELCLGEVRRYELDNLLGLNFLLEQSLGGGGSCTLRTDAQGKTFSHALLRQKITVPQDVIDEVNSYSLKTTKKV